MAGFALPEVSGIGPELRAYPARFEQAKKNGLDPGFRELQARDAAKPADARKAFDELEAFVKKSTGLNLASQRPPEVHGTSKAAIAARAARWELHSYRHELRQLGKASKKAVGGTHYNLKYGYDLSVTSVTPLRTGAEIAQALVARDAGRGEFAAATQNIVDAAAPWEVYGSDPDFINDVVRTVSSGVQFHSAGRLLAHPAYPSSEIRRLEGVAEGAAFVPMVPIGRFLAHEASLVHSLLDRLGEEQTTSMSRLFSTDVLDWGSRFSQVRRTWQSDNLRRLNDAVASLPADPYDFDGIERTLVDYARTALAPRGLRGTFVNRFAPHTSHVGTMQRRREAMRRVLLLASALRRGESEPAARSRLGRFALDPYDGQPLRVRNTTSVPYWLAKAPTTPIARELRAVYSVGQNRTDDGGTAAPDQANGDVVLVIPR